MKLTFDQLQLAGTAACSWCRAKEGIPLFAWKWPTAQRNGQRNRLDIRCARVSLQLDWLRGTAVHAACFVEARIQEYTREGEDVV